MLDTRVGGVEFWAINTDAQALGRSKAKGAQVLNIGGAVTRGLGAGGDPEVGRLAAEFGFEQVKLAQGADTESMVSALCEVASEVCKRDGK